MPVRKGRHDEVSLKGSTSLMNWLRLLLMGMVAYAAFSVATTARSEEIGINEPFLEPLGEEIDLPAKLNLSHA
jgi:hypothetical protein